MFLLDRDSAYGFGHRFTQVLLVEAWLGGSARTAHEGKWPTLEVGQQYEATAE